MRPSMWVPGYRGGVPATRFHPVNTRGAYGVVIRYATLTSITSMNAIYNLVHGAAN